MEVKPVITIHGETDLIGPVFQKTLQTKFKALQRNDYSKDETAFASFCQGVEFKPFQDFYREHKKDSYVYYVHKEPCLHTFWTGCSDVSSYNTSVKPMIDHWISDTSSIDGSSDTCMLAIVYCVTAEVRSKRSRLKASKLGGKYETIEELIVKDYRNKCSITNIRFASADTSRIADSFNSYALEINKLALQNFLSRVSVVNNELREKRIKKVDKEEVYKLICQKLSLSICYEMIRDPLQASTRYALVHDDLEFAITVLSQVKEVPEWVKRIKTINISTWNYPSLLDTSESWKYLNDIIDNKAHIIHIWTFLFVRRILTLCGRGLVNEVYRCCIQTLHCTARLINMLKLPIPVGVFNSWAYMSCLECVESMMVMIDPEVLANTSSSSLILVRAELWHYAWEKLRSIGLLCHLMPGSQVPVTPNQPIISTICSGINITPFIQQASANDQGARLVEVLQSKEKYKNAFMSLGEMVIGAFKHAGRRRMAFSIGTRMAEFHKEVGMVKEAEQLLCDVTSLHSVQHWPQLSSSAYSILAHCQHKLRQEDKQVNSLLVLVTTPTYDNSNHNPAHYMDQLITIAERSKYQKLLSWEPLFDFDSLSYHHTNSLHKGDEISLNIAFNYSGPKPMQLTVVSAILEPDYQVTSVAMGTNKKFSLKESLETFEEIDLEPGPPEEVLLSSRPVGGDRGSKLHKVYYSSSDLTGGEGVVKSNAHKLIKMGVVCHNGINNVTVKGKISTPGRYFIQQIILKSGALDFCSVVPTATSELHPLTILPDKVNISIGLKTQQDVILSGVPTQCELEIISDKDTLINKGAELVISAPPTVQLESLDDDPVIDHKLTLSLPSQDAGGICFPFDMTVSSLYQSTPTFLGYHGNQDEGLLRWKFELEVYCNWLTPPHSARLPLMIYEPFSFTHKECSSGENTFLQITMVNSCPLPLGLERHSLTGQPRLLSLNENIQLPKVFYPGESFSFLWRNRKTVGVTNSTMNVSNGSLCVYYHPLNNELTSAENIKTPSRIAEYKFSLSNMDTIYHLKVSVESVLPLHPIATHQHVFINYTLINITRDFRDSAHQPHPLKLHYTVQADSAQWNIGNKRGVVEAPGIAQSVSFRITATLKLEGHLATPTCSFVLERQSEGESEKLNLTNAQFYDTTQQQYIAVIEGTGRPF